MEWHRAYVYWLSTVAPGAVLLALAYVTFRDTSVVLSDREWELARNPWIFVPVLASLLHIVGAINGALASTFFRGKQNGIALGALRALIDRGTVVLWRICLSAKCLELRQKPKEGEKPPPSFDHANSRPSEQAIPQLIGIAIGLGGSTGEEMERVVRELKLLSASLIPCALGVVVAAVHCAWGLAATALLVAASVWAGFQTRATSITTVVLTRSDAIHKSVNPHA